MKNNEKIIVAQIVGKWLGGGVESVVMNYYKNIDREKVQFDFICDEDSTSIPYDEIEKLGGRVIIVPPYQKLFKYHKELKKIFKQNNYKIVHSHINTLSVFSLFAAKCANIPVRIAHSHSTTSPKEFKRNILKNILKHFSKLFATDYFACSEKAARFQFGNKSVDNGQVVIINNAIDVNKFEYNEKIRKSIREELNIKEDELVIGHIGRFVTVKNHCFIIDIFNNICTTEKNIKLILAGDGPLIEDLKQKVKSLNLEEKVIFLGQCKEIHKIYQALDVFILPSLYEGLPVVGVEAQASGLPCIFSNKMTKEVKILDSTKFLDIESGEEIWKKEILENLKNQRIKNSKEILAKNNLDRKSVFQPELCAGGR